MILDQRNSQRDDLNDLYKIIYKDYFVRVPVMLYCTRPPYKIILPTGKISQTDKNCRDQY